MNKYKLSIALVTLTLIIAGISMSFNKTPEVKHAISKTKRPGGSSVSGQASLLMSYFNDKVQHFSFQASVDEKGNVTGSWESKSPGQEIRTHGTITCVIFLDNKTAVMTGVITKKDGDGFAKFKEGDPVWFKVRDNGEGANAKPDEFTDYYIAKSIPCRDFPNLKMTPIIGGNIQVKR